MKFMDKILRKSHKIFKFLFLILILALIFFFWSGKKIFQKIESPSQSIGQFQVQPLNQGFQLNETNLNINNFRSNLPEPNKFPSFVYPQKKSLDIKIKCADVYYTILIFNSKDDYRKNPEVARFNKAFPCSKNETFRQSIDLTTLNLASGRYYYIIADQGEKGSWYNPK